MSQKLAWLPPMRVVQLGCSSLAMVISFFAELYRRVVEVTPNISVGTAFMRLRKVS